MRNASWWLAGVLAVAAIGCSGGTGLSTTPVAPGDKAAGNQPVPASQSSGGNAGLGQVLQSSDISQSALAIYTVHVDPQTLAATAALKQLRHGADNDDLYLLPIDSFLKPNSFTVTGVGGDADSVDLGWQFSHPFPAPSNPTGTPNGSTNRADLGVAVELIFLSDVASATGNTYFTDRVANTSMVLNADCYYSPGALVTTTGMLANTFPMISVVDEAADNRAGVSNGGSVTGNFGADGWTRSELGGTNDGWTGYDILNQGQTAKGTVELSKTELLANGFDLDVAVIAKYNDPRGGANATEKKANRLPPAAADTTKFAYRMPHGDIDVSGVTFNSITGDFLDSTVSAATLYFNVIDWDARATETTSPALKDDTDPTNVAIGEAGLPDFAVCIPGVLGNATVIDDWDPSSDVQDDDSLYGGDVTQDSGQPGDALFYCKSVTETLTTGQAAGTYTGMARATDPEIANITDPFFVIELDGSLSPLSTNIPSPISYCPFQVNVVTANAVPTASFSTPANVLSGFATTTSVTVTAAGDAEAEPITVEIDWDGGADSFVAAGVINSPYTPLPTYTSPAAGLWSNATASPIARTINVRFKDPGHAFGNAPDLSTSLGANRPPVVTGTTALAAATLPSPATFSMTIGTSTISDPENDQIGLYVVNNRNADVITRGPVAVGSYATLFPFNANTTAITNPPNATVNFVPYATDATHTGLGGPLMPVVVGNITAGGCVPPGNSVFLADFSTATGTNAWVAGQLFSPALPNTDDATYSHFKGAAEGFCTALANQTSLSGGMANTGGDVGFTGCTLNGNDWINDYQTNLDNNIVSPTFSLAGKTSAVLTFNSCKLTDSVDATNTHYRVYISTNNGTSWTSIYDVGQVASNTQQNETAVTVNIPAGQLGSATTRLRFQFLDTRGSFVYYVGYTSNVAGWSFDTVNVKACP